MVYSKEFEGLPSSLVPDLCDIVVDGQFRLMEVLGRGAWGVVYSAYDVNKPELEYAVKCIWTGEMTSHQLRCISHELKLHRRCSNALKNALKLHHFYEDTDSGMMYFVTELCEGGDLLDLIDSGEYIGDDEKIREAFLQVLDAVDGCHELGVYHRDLKPENFLMKKDRQIVVGDFGFATTKKEVYNFGMGSEPYMSPEVRGGLRYKLRSYSTPDADIWALGVILMNLITGYGPWVKASMDDKMFSRYVNYDRDALYRMYPISRDANEILKSIFTIYSGERRTSIAELRERVKAAKNFGPGSWNNMTVAEREGRYTEDLLDDVDSDTLSVRSDDTDSDSLSDGSEEEVAIELPLRVVNREVTISSNVEPLAAVSTDETEFAHISAPDAGIVSDIDSDDSDVESDGPLTPETHAVDAGADEPAIAIGSGGASALENLDKMAELSLVGASSVVQKQAKAVEKLDAVLELVRLNLNKSTYGNVPPRQFVVDKVGMNGRPDFTQRALVQRRPWSVSSLPAKERVCWFSV